MIYNPTAGPRRVRRGLKAVRRELERRGWSVDVKATQSPGDATRLAREASGAGLDAVWIAGGDGTISEAVNGLVGTNTALGVLPVGTGNIWAKQLGLPTLTLTHPFRLREAAIAQAEGKVQAVDVGRVNDRYFLLWAGIGFDAMVTTELEPRPRPVKRLGALPYIVASVTLARSFSGVRARVALDEQTVRGRILLVLVTNVQMYSLFQVARQACMDDGLLDALVFKGLGSSYILRHAARMFRGRHLQDPKTVHRQVRRIVVQAEEPLSVQVDGDPLGTTPVTLSVVPRALRIRVPHHVPSNLFHKEEL
ncbi:MAG: diacylglycerol kinase family lipid kinase [Anaerolineae bacterium]|jgi:YegS/Rv2252/BmrU family lipid kinase